MYPRLVVDDLPGYFLEPYSGEGDEIEKKAHISWSIVLSMPSALSSAFYIARPRAIQNIQVYSISIKIRNRFTSKKQTTSNLREFDYKIEVEKMGSNLG